jgi:hypothetical protein
MGVDRETIGAYVRRTVSESIRQSRSTSRPARTAARRPVTLLEVPVQISPPWRRTATALAAIAVAGSLTGLAACSSSPSSTNSGSVGGTFTVWDPYPQFDDASAWVQTARQVRLGHAA